MKVFNYDINVNKRSSSPQIVRGTAEQYINNFEDFSASNTFNRNHPEIISTIQTCVQFLSNGMQAFPVDFFRMEGNENIKVNDDPRWMLLNDEVNDWMNSKEFFRVNKGAECYAGNAFSYIKKDFGKPVELEFIPNKDFQGYQIKNGMLFYFFKGWNKGNGIYSKDILHFKNLSKGVGALGIDPITSLVLHLSTNEKGLKTMEKFLSNYAMAGKIVEMASPETFEGEDLEELLKQWEKSIQGYQNAGKIWVAPPYSTIKNNKIDLKSVELLSTLKFNAEMIAALYGVPPYIAGLYESSKVSTVKDLQMIYKVFNLNPSIKGWEAELKNKLLLPSERKAGMTIKFDLEAILEADFDSKLAGLEAGIKNGYLTPNDAARKQGLPTYEGGDTYYVSNNHMMVTALEEKRVTEIEKLKAEIEKIKAETEKINKSF